MKYLGFFRVAMIFFLLFFYACAAPMTLIEEIKESGDNQGTTKTKDIKESEDNKDYVLGPEDVVEIMVWKERDVSKTVTVRPDGKISLPLIDDVQAAGFKVEELKEEITEKLREFIANPTVSVVVSQMNSMKVFIQGEVARQGVYQLKSNTTVLQGISLAGGFNEWSKRKKIIIVREIEGKRVRIRVDYGKIFSGKDMKQNILLKRGDIVIVP